MAALVWVLWTAAIMAEGATAPLAAELVDLDGQRSTVRASEARPQVVMIVRARRLRGLRVWEKNLRERFDGLSYARIADFPEDPRVTYDDIASKLRERVPEGVQVFVDVERRWARDLGLDTSRPNLLLFDDGGNLRATFQGRYEPDLFEQVCDSIEGLRRRHR